MKKIHKFMLFLLIIEVLIIIPIFDRLLYGHSDPFVSHIIVSSYVLNKTGDLENTVSFLAQTFHNINGKTWIWQIATGYLLKDYIVGASLLLYTTGTVSNIDYLILGYSPIIYFIYMGLMSAISFKMIKKSASHAAGIYNVVIVTAVISGGLSFLTNFVFTKLIGFQYHAVALVMYLGFILLFMRYLEHPEQRTRIFGTMLILYTAVTITHYRFPTLILGNTLIFGVFITFVGLVSTGIEHKKTSRTLFIVSGLLFIVLYFQPFYWSTLKQKGENYLDILLLVEYLINILSGQREAGGPTLGYTPILTTLQKYDIYMMFTSWILLIILLAIFVIKSFKLEKYDPSLYLQLLFLWSVGSTVVYNFTYFLYYQGLTGLSIYEPWILVISSVLIIIRARKDIYPKLIISIANIVIIIFCLTLVTNSSLILYQAVVYPPHPDPPRYQTDTALPFLWNMGMSTLNGGGIVIGSSFSVSAEIYEQTAKHNTLMLPYIGSRRIVDEVLQYRETSDMDRFLSNLKNRNDFLVITKYEERKGLSSDVFRLKSYLLSNEVQNVKLSFDWIYNSELVIILDSRGR
ncbi:F0F1 ATP synthase subunit A [Pyrococcus sp. NA2]|uniref:hypothetical protein n=1 Tax=Pyrococcus sp. (strain NA2) TaxID=342949 RepID=UPI000209A9FF|nr:hypothetical protein [Pyrococcus sp. NA2]AEC51940.1 F0F1 ATP synthase subunit A [Pyrococcus sp. NA2]